MPNDSNKISNSTHFNNPVDEKTKLDLLKSLITAKTNVKIFMDQKNFDSVTYPSSDINKISVICANSAVEQAFKMSKELTCHFSLHNEMYFFTSKTTFTDTSIIFSTPSILYKIERRDNFRVSVPKKMTQHIEIVGIKQLKVKLEDLSLGGCKVSVLYPEASLISHLKSGVEVTLEMTFLSFENQTVYCKIKFRKDNLIAKSASIGLEFEKLKADEVKEMQANIFKIDRLNRQSNMD